MLRGEGSLPQRRVKWGVPLVSQFLMDHRTIKKIDSILDSCGIVPPAGLSESIFAYLKLLEKWNRKLNLTGVYGLEELVRLHFAESFLGATLIQPGEGPILDVGSGAGFPGMAMKLILPGESIYLVESRVKRAAFLSTVRRELKLPGVTVVNHTLQQCQPQMFPSPPNCSLYAPLAIRWKLSERQPGC